MIYLYSAAIVLACVGIVLAFVFYFKKQEKSKNKLKNAEKHEEIEKKPEFSSNNDEKSKIVEEKTEKKTEEKTDDKKEDLLETFSLEEEKKEKAKEELEDHPFYQKIKRMNFDEFDDEDFDSNDLDNDFDDDFEDDLDDDKITKIQTYQDMIESQNDSTLPKKSVSNLDDDFDFASLLRNTSQAKMELDKLAQELIENRPIDNIDDDKND